MINMKLRPKLGVFALRILQHAK